MTWNVAEIQKWGTLIAAALAAIASSLNLWWKYREKADKIKVVHGPIDPQIEPGEFLHVVSLCDHPVRLADYGFVMPTGKLLSLPYMFANEPDDDLPTTTGSLLLESRNALFELGTTLRDRPVGVYARTTAQTRPTVAFRYDTPLWMRIWLRLMIWRKVVYD